MPEEKREFATLRFTGPRFDDHGLDIDVLPELISYKRLLIETAKEIWRRRNPERQRLPRGFEANVVIKFFRLQPGSTEVPLVRQVEKCEAPLLPLFDEQADEIDEAAETLDYAIDAAGSGQPAPETLPRSVIPFFREFGQTLRENEAIFIRAGSRGNVARYDRHVRERVLLWGEQVYEDMIDLSGEVRSTDLDRCSFALKLDDGRKVAGQYAPEQEALILDALGEHDSQRLRVRATGEFSHDDGILKRIVHVESVSVIGPVGGKIDALARPVWEVVAEIGTAVPPDDWARVPKDLAENLDRYLYGKPKAAS